VKEPKPISDAEERRLRARHADHPFCDACYVLAQLDVERAAHKLDALSFGAFVDSQRVAVARAEGRVQGLLFRMAEMKDEASHRGREPETV
jgi:hypothetical protein